MGISLTSDGGSILASWLEPIGAEAHRVRFAALDIASGRWGEASTVAEGEDVLASAVALPTTMRGASGTLFTTFLRRGAGDEASFVHIAASSNGVTWRSLGPVHDDATDTEHGHVSLLAEGDGVRVVWLDGRAAVESGPTAIRTALFDSDGRRMGGDVLDERVCDCCQTAATTTTDGPLIVYRDRTDDERRDLAHVRRAGDRWTRPTELANDGWTIRGCPVNGPQVAAEGERVVVHPGPRGDAGGSRSCRPDSESRGALPHRVAGKAPGRAGRSRLPAPRFRAEGAALALSRRGSAGEP